MSVTVGKKVPAFKFEASTDEFKKLSDLKGKNIIMYFYPKDSTSGCTKEAEDFRDNYNKFKRANTIVIGVSRDSMKSHQKFIEKIMIPFPLISDPEEELCSLFDVMREKSMYGRKYMGIDRSTFFIDEKGVLREAWRNVKVPGHVDEVLETVKAANKK